MPHNTKILLGFTTSLLLSISVAPLRGQHIHFEPGDWQYISSTAKITSASEGTDGVYFSTYDGLILFNYYSQNLELLPEVNMGLPSHSLYQVYFDASTNALWVVYAEGIAFRLSTEDTWREVPLTSLPDYFHGRKVTRIGGSFEGIWVDMEGLYTLLHSFTGEYLNQFLSPPDVPVDWNTSENLFLDPPELLGWTNAGEWMTNVYEFLGPGFVSAIPTVVIRDRNDMIWYGTDLGTLFRGDSFTRRLEPFQVGIAPSPVIVLYVDGDRIWFADNSYRRQGQLPSSKGGYFLSSWDSKVSSWRYFSSLSSEAIRDARVNDMLRMGRELWLATMDGIVLLNTRNETWGFLGTRQGLRDRAVWDLEQHGREVFSATIRGVDRIDPATHQALPEDSTSISPQVEVYCLTSSGPVLYAGTAAGIYAFQYGRAVKWWRISNLPAVSLWSQGEELFAVAHNVVYHRDGREEEFTLHPVHIPDGAKILEIKGYGSYIWLATSRGAVVYDTRKRRQFMIGIRDGLPSEVVYSLEPGADWVWFLTGDGVLRLKWRAYFD